MKNNGIVFDIQSYSLYDGPGIRTAIYLKGCPLKCFWCHNPESQKKEIEIAFWEDRCTKCHECKGIEGCHTNALEQIGKVYEVPDLVQEVLKDQVYFKKSGGGVTITGGEPTYQKEFLFELLIELKKYDLHVALETCGSFGPAIAEKLIKYVDLFLFDLKQIDNAKHILGTGVSNDLILENFKVIHQKVGSQRIIVRIPLIPGFNNDQLSLGQFQDYLNSQNFTGEIHALPYHNMGVEKYKRIGRTDIPTVRAEDKPELDKYLALGILYGR